MKAFVTFAQLVTPLFVVGIPLYAWFRRVDVYSVFLRGAGEGFRSLARMAPAVLCMFTAVGLLSESGAMDLAGPALAPLARALDTPEDILVLSLIRPLSGSGALGLLARILSSKGPDSFEGILASTVQGSTDTAIYVVALYFGSVGIARTRHVPIVALLAAAAGTAAAVVACRLSAISGF